MTFGLFNGIHLIAQKHLPLKIVTISRTKKLLIISSFIHSLMIHN